MLKKHLPSISVIVLVVYLIIRPILSEGNYPSHDITHLSRIFYLEQSMESGQFPPIWANTANFNYGYPLLHLYAPLSYYISYFFKYVGFSLLSSYEFSFILAVLFAAFGMYKYTLRWGKWGALLSAISYISLPYLAVNIYIRAALAETWSFAILPWLFHYWGINGEAKTTYIYRSLVTSLFILSHNLIPIITLPFLIIWIFISRLSLKSIIYSATLTLALSSFYLLPLLFERSFTLVESVAKTSDFRLHFVEPWQLWNSTWGFGGSAPGVQDGMSFKIGKLHLILASLSAGFALKNRFKEITALFIFLGISVLMTTSLSNTIWESTSYLQIVQFPWRFLTLIGFFTTSIIAYFINQIPKRHVISCSFILALLFLNLKYFKPQEYDLDYESKYSSKDFREQTLAKVIPEYVPFWSKTLKDSYSERLIDDKNISYEYLEDGKIAIDAGGEPREIRVNKLYYPTWKAQAGDRNVEVKEKDGLILFDVDQFNKTIMLYQSNTLLQRLSSYLSLSAIIYSLYFLQKDYRKRFK